MASIASTVNESNGKSAFGLDLTLAEVNRLEKVENDVRTPFKTFYEARKILEEKRKTLEKQHETLKTTGKDTTPIANAIAVLNYRIGKNFYTTEENHEAQVNLEKAILQLAPENWINEDKASDGEKKGNKQVEASEFSWVSCLNNPYMPQLIDAYNQIGALWVSRGDVSKAKLNLNRALKIYESILKLDDGSSSDDDTSELRSIHIFTLFYLAQVEGQLGNATASSNHVRKTLILQRQSEAYDPFEWAINCAQLHTFYYNQNHLREAENCLLCAQEIANNELPDPEFEADGKTPVNIDDDTLRVRCSIWRMWGTLYSKQLQLAKDNLEIRFSDPENLSGFTTQDDKMALVEPSICTLTMQPDVIAKRRAPCVQDITDAKIASEVFKLARVCYEKSLHYFVMDGRVTEHVNVQQEISKLYMYLSAFETAWKRAVGMHTRRVSLLSPLYDELNKNVFVVLCKELSFECGQALQAIQDVHELRSGQAEKGSKKFISATKKADKAGVDAIVHFEKFLGLFKTQDGKDPVLMDKDNLPSYLMCKLNIARICGKMHAYGDNTSKVEWLKKSLEHYQFIVDFGKRNIPNALEEQKKDAFLEGMDTSAIKPIFQEELQHCKEMISLLPEKINRLHYLNHDISG